jgi:hypothetical protein
MNVAPEYHLTDIEAKYARVIVDKARRLEPQKLHFGRFLACSNGCKGLPRTNPLAYFSSS